MFGKLWSAWQLSIVNKYSPSYHFLDGAKYLALGGTVIFSITVMW